MKLQHATWPEIEAYLRESQAILIPIGSTEQHGPTGMIGTDILCPEIIADAMAEQSRILIGPSLSVGMAQHHLAFPGSISLRPSTLIRVLSDVIASLSGQGFTHFFFLNGHGGNIATVQAAFSEIWSGSSFAGVSSRVRLRLHNWFQGEQVGRLSRKIFGDGEGSHATPSEISLVLSAYPQDRRQVPLHPERAPSGPILDAADFRRRHPDGRMGARSALATEEHGERLRQAATADALEAWQRFVSL